MATEKVLGGEPAVTVGAVVAAIAVILSLFGVTADLDKVTTIVTVVLPLVTAVITRFFVRPVTKDQVGV